MENIEISKKFIEKIMVFFYRQMIEPLIFIDNISNYYMMRKEKGVYLRKELYFK